MTDGWESPQRRAREPYANATKICLLYHGSIRSEYGIAACADQSTLWAHSSGFMGKMDFMGKTRRWGFAQAVGSAEEVPSGDTI
jgi:hypothetical protein